MQVPAILVTGGLILLVAAVFGDPIKFLGGALPGARGKTRVIAGVLGGMVFAAGLGSFYVEASMDGGGATTTTTSPSSTSATTTIDEPDPATAPLNPPVVDVFEALSRPDKNGCISLQWSVRNAETVFLGEGSTRSEVPLSATREVCGSEGDRVVLSAQGPGGTEQRFYDFAAPTLSIEVESTARGNTAEFRVTTNAPVDVTVGLLSGEMEMSENRSTHLITIRGLPFGESIEWEVIASAADGQKEVVSGTLKLQYVYARATIVDPPTRVRSGFNLTTTTGRFEPKSVPVVFATQPDFLFIGETGCSITYDAETAKDMLFVPALDGSASASFSALLCSFLSSSRKLELADVDTVPLAEEMQLPAGDNELSTFEEVSIELGGGESIEFGVLFERIFLDEQQL